MVSKAREDFPEPEIPVKTTSESRASSRCTLRRLCSRAPRITRASEGPEGIFPGMAAIVNDAHVTSGGGCRPPTGVDRSACGFDTDILREAAIGGGRNGERHGSGRHRTGRVLDG